MSDLITVENWCDAVAYACEQSDNDGETVIGDMSSEFQDELLGYIVDYMCDELPAKNSASLILPAMTTQAGANINPLTKAGAREFSVNLIRSHADKIDMGLNTFAFLENM